MKKNLIAAVLAAGCISLTLSAMSFPISAEIIGSGECGEHLTWTLDDTGTLTISGEGEMWDYEYGSDDKDAPWRVQMYDLLFNGNILEDGRLEWSGIEIQAVIEDGVTSIGAWAFADLGYININLPDSITVIGYGAFAHTGAAIDIPSNVIEIDDMAFWGCENEEITLPASLERIGESAFMECPNLNSVTVLNPDCVFGSACLDGFNGTIYGYSNSTAQAYAEYCGYSFVSLDAEETSNVATDTSFESSSSATETSTTPATPTSPPKTGDNGTALALAGLLIAAGAAFVIRRKD